MKRIFRYFHATSDYGLCYQGGPRLDRVLDISGFVDVVWVGDMYHRRSISGYVFNLFGGAVRDGLQWHFQLQMKNTWHPLMQARK